MEHGQNIADMSFEAALNELETIVSRLEKGDAELDLAIQLYERGNRLKTHCEKTLKDAEERIEKITLDAQGNPTGTELRV